jgi:hypothetical protein
MGFQPPKPVAVRPIDLDKEVPVPPEPKATEDGRAKYKLEVLFGRRRTVAGLNPVIVTIWESGKRFHGGGDEKMYWCGYRACSMPIVVASFLADDVLCPSCKRRNFCDPQTKQAHVDNLKKRLRDTKQVDKTAVIVGERLMNLPMSKLAKVLAQYWRGLGHGADLYLKYHRTDLRYDTLHEDHKAPAILDKARNTREPGIYTLKAILKDTLSGKSVEDTFLAFLTA